MEKGFFGRRLMFYIENYYIFSIISILLKYFLGNRKVFKLNTIFFCYAKDKKDYRCHWKDRKSVV